MPNGEKLVVLLGGESEEREVSLRSGKAIAKALRQLGHELDEFDWHPNRLMDFLSHGYEKVFIALHGGSGENGSVQSLLDLAGIPYTGCRMRPAAITMDKHLTKVIVRAKTCVPVPECRAIPVPKALERVSQNIGGRWNDIIDAIGLPLVAKPASNGSSIGVSLVFEEAALDEAVKKAAVCLEDHIMFEQYIGAYELTVALLDGKAMGVCQIIPHNAFYDYEAKYIRNDTQYLTPSSLGEDFDRKLCEMAETVAEALSCTDGIVRIDFLADADKKAYFLEVNTVPGMTEKSLVPMIARQAGFSFESLCAMILATAR